MHRFFRTALGTGLAVGICAAASAQPMAPDPTHIPFVPPDKIVWQRVAPGEDQAKLFGDASKPGPYGVLIRWQPGFYSHPHFHNTDRWAYVVSGTWWVSSSNVDDPSKTYPMPAGTFVTDLGGTVHFDGAKAGGEPAILELVGMGPVVTTQVDATGKPKTPN